ncbi:hypothetical protein LT85_1013 [Collimonas arenae]|uniref:Uncharacterized protein n=1 Tax=Collimonas arenae TaxID=279058 RepID=A0A0A1F6M8_9BURK|nr:hypothetical protein [Collimonas arenae]AIY40171.1 hypothetical protein LT85_1013 [Collimonas arenae]
MSKVTDAFAAIKAKVEGAMQLADPETALKEAEHAFMDVLAAAHEELDQRVAALEAMAKPAVAEVEAVAKTGAGEAEGILGKIGDFVEHLVHPDAVPVAPAEPVSTAVWGTAAAPATATETAPAAAIEAPGTPII